MTENILEKIEKNEKLTVEELGDYIRRIEFEINSQVNGTKELAMSTVSIELEKGGSL